MSERHDDPLRNLPPQPRPGYPVDVHDRTVFNMMGAALLFLMLCGVTTYGVVIKGMDLQPIHGGAALMATFAAGGFVVAAVRRHRRRKTWRDGEAVVGRITRCVKRRSNQSSYYIVRYEFPGPDGSPRTAGAPVSFAFEEHETVGVIYDPNVPSRTLPWRVRRH